jgi:hypothetical protein
MAQHGHVSQNDRQLKKINAYAKHISVKANELSKQEQDESDQKETQMKL